MKESSGKRPSSEGTKRPPGRPRKAPAEKAQQFSISLPGDVRFGLELIRRERGITLSSAVEYAIRRLMDTYEVDGKTVKDRSSLVGLLEDRLSGDSKFDVETHDGTPYTQEEKANFVRQFFQITQLARLQSMPERLLTGEERYVLAVIEAIKGPLFITLPSLLMERILQGYEDDRPAQDVARRFSSEAKKLLKRDDQALDRPRRRKLKG